jgi:hypothetical protein
MSRKYHVGQVREIYFVSGSEKLFEWEVGLGMFTAMSSFTVNLFLDLHFRLPDTPIDSRWDGFV